MIRAIWRSLVLVVFASMLLVNAQPAAAAAKPDLVLQVRVTQNVSGVGSVYVIPGVANIVDIAPVPSINDKFTMPAPTGRVVVKVNGQNFFDGPIQGWNTKSIIDPLPAGNNVFALTYFGDSNYNPGSREILVQAFKSRPITFNSTSPCAPPITVKQCYPNVFPGQPTVIDAYSETRLDYMPWPTGRVQFSHNGNLLGTAAFANNYSRFETRALPAGLQCVDILWPGDGTYEPSQTAQQCFWINGPGEVPVTAAEVKQGYRLTASNGTTTYHGGRQFTAEPLQSLNAPIVGGATNPTSWGNWMVASDGGVFTAGSARFYGSTGSIRLNKPIVGMASTVSGNGYWLVASDGGVFAYGDAKFYGSTGSIRLNKPIVGMSRTPSGGGYWLVASDGGIFAFGDAGFFGSTGSIRLNQPIVGMTHSPSGDGYWMVASDGGIFAFASAAFHGSTGAQRLNKPIVGMAKSQTGRGYWLLASDGGVFTFGDAKYAGSGVNQSATPFVSIAED